MIENMTVKTVEGIPLLMPDFVADNWPKLKILDFPNFCGAGDGFAEKIIPEKRYGVSFKPACFIHDITHSYFPNEKKYFYFSNVILFYNCFMMIIHKEGFMKKILLPFRIYSAATYLIGVSTDIGFECFENGKEERRESNYKWYLDIHIIETFLKVGIKPIDFIKR